MKNVLVMFGGMSAEHEVSVITGLQVLENIDRTKYNVIPVIQAKDGNFFVFKDIKDRKSYNTQNGKIARFGKNNNGIFIQAEGLFSGKIFVDAAYLAFHGGTGERGQVQGLLESLGLPHTSPSCESSVIAMNKSLTKEVLISHNMPSLPSISFNDLDAKEHTNDISRLIIERLGLPVIIKPVHLGSSIGIGVSKTEVELQKNILTAAMMDTEILAEKYIIDFKEYNCAVRKINDRIETSEVEKPLQKDEILSFADKYQRGGKKTGGMASLSRELPAKISEELKAKIQILAKEVFQLIRAKGMVRIDFMVKGEEIFITEVNPIPGSMSFYLWEASGISFKDQITDLIEQAISDQKKISGKKLEYHTDIIEKFVSRDQ